MLLSYLMALLHKPKTHPSMQLDETIVENQRKYEECDVLLAYE